MTRTRKYILALLLCTALLLALSAAVFADGLTIASGGDEINASASGVVASGDCGNNVKWTLKTDNTLYISGNGAMTDYTFLEDGSINTPWYNFRNQTLTVQINSGVTRIGSYAFCDCSSLTSATIPSSVTSIGRCGFTSCESLTDVMISNGVVSIENNAFAGCESLNSVFLPRSLQSLGSGVFMHCRSLTEISIPVNVTSIGDETFRECTDLTSVTIPQGVTSIGKQAFFYCNSLTNVAIPKNVTSIGKEAFSHCGLTSVTIPASVRSIGDFVFEACSKLTTVEINQGLTGIGTGMFFSCDSLSSVTVPQGVKSIGRVAFCGCSSLTSVTIPQSVTSIGESAFEGCSSLENVTIPQSVTSIEVSAFEGCSSLENVTIPQSVTSIGVSAFEGCSSLESVNIPSGIKKINNSVFSGCSNLETISIPQNVKSIGSYSFYGCSRLTSIVIPDGVTSIGDNAFGGCAALTSVTIPEGVTNINYGLFCKCTGLTSVYIPGEVTSIGSDAFSYCKSLTDVFFSANREKWSNIAIGVNNSELHNAKKHLVPTITEQPTNLEVKKGDTALFKVTAIDVDLTEGCYKWEYRKSSTENWKVIPGANQPVYSFSTADEDYDGYQYRCSVTSSMGNVCSKTVTLIVVDIPFINSQPSDVTADEGATVTFSVAASGNGLSYQWEYRSRTDKPWSALSVEESRTPNFSLEVKALHNGYQFRCKVSNEFGEVYSRAALLRVNSRPVITKQPKSISVQSGAWASFEVEATGATGYQWYSKAPNSSSWKAIDGETNAGYVFTVSLDHNGYEYKCVLSNAIGETESNTATLTVFSGAPTITAQPTDFTVTEGNSAKFSVTASGEGLSYQWYYRTSSTSSTWNKVSAASGKAATYVISSAKASHNGYQYKCIVSNNAGSVDSNIVTLTVVATPIINLQPRNETVNEGRSVSLCVGATGGNLQYQWFYSKSSSDGWHEVTAASGKTAIYKFTAKAEHNGRQYRCRVTNVMGDYSISIYSQSVTLTVNLKPVITTQPKNASINAGEKVRFSVKATGAESYQWYRKRPDEDSFTAIGVGTSSVYSFMGQPGDDGCQYYCVVANSVGKVYTITVTLTVN